MSALKASAIVATAILAFGAVSVPHVAEAGQKADTCKPAKAVHKAKTSKAKTSKAKVHKTKARAKTAKAKTVAAASKTKPKAKVAKVAAAPCDCRKEVHIVKVVQPVIEREVTVYRAEPRQWHAPYVDEVSQGPYAEYSETAHTGDYAEERTYRVAQRYERHSYSSDARADYLAVDTRPHNHRDKRYTEWVE